MKLPKVLTEVPHWDEPKFENPLAVRADSDGDGVLDPWDCQPFNPAEQGWFDDKVRSFAQHTGRRIVQGSQRYARRSMSASQRRQSTQRSNQRRKQQRKQQQRRTQQRKQQQRRTQQRSSGRGTTWAPRSVHYISRGSSGGAYMVRNASRAPQRRRR